MVQTEGMITQLVFEHSLRVRFTEEASTPASSKPATAIATPELREVTSDEHSADEDTNGSSEGGQSTFRGSSTTRVPTESSGSTTNPKSTSSPSKGSGGGDKDKDKPSTQGTNLVGKITNLISTDLGNLVDGRDFLFLIWYSPLQIAFCVWFLYVILDWSAFVGMGFMILSIPLPGGYPLSFRIR